MLVQDVIMSSCKCPVANDIGVKQTKRTIFIHITSMGEKVTAFSIFDKTMSNLSSNFRNHYSQYSQENQ